MKKLAIPREQLKLCHLSKMGQHPHGGSGEHYRGCPVAPGRQNFFYYCVNILRHYCRHAPTGSAQHNHGGDAAIASTP